MGSDCIIDYLFTLKTTLRTNAFEIRFSTSNIRLKTLLTNGFETCFKTINIGLKRPYLPVDLRYVSVQFIYD